MFMMRMFQMHECKYVCMFQLHECKYVCMLALINMFISNVCFNYMNVHESQTHNSNASITLTYALNEYS